MEAKPEEVVLNRFGMDDEEDESYDVDNKEELNNLLVPSLAASDEFLPVEEQEEEESAGPWGLWGFYSYSFASEVSRGRLVYASVVVCTDGGIALPFLRSFRLSRAACSYVRIHVGC